MIGYESIRVLAGELKCAVRDLIAESTRHDPFYAGMPSNKAMAEWFAEIWQDFGSPIGMHLRGLHYKLVSQENPKRHTGAPYENTQNDWNYLKNAAKYARWLGLVPLDALPDRRNPNPHIFMRKDLPVDEYGREITKPEWEPESADWSMPSTGFYLDSVEWELPKFSIRGYEYYDALQPYHIEVWIEKSTMDDVLIPICQRHAVNFITGLGNMSIPSVKDLLERIAELGKPTRILYVSDFDPGGEGMPISVARQIEYLLSNLQLWWQEEEAKFNVKLDPIVLTKAQVKRYKLPKIPIKDTDTRKRRFEDRYGEGAVELDALEALHPGVLAQIVEKHILEFRDENLESRIVHAEFDLQKQLNGEWSEKIGPFEENLEELKQKVEEIVDSYRGRLDDVNAELAQDLEPFEEQLKTLRLGITERFGEFEVGSPSMPEAEIEEKERKWFFDSSREYLDQLMVYKRKKKLGIKKDRRYK